MKLPSNVALKAHRQADLLRAIADGHTLEFRENYTSDVWRAVDSEDTLKWYCEAKDTFYWRIKPEPKPDIKEKITCAYGYNGFYIKFHEKGNYDGRPNLELTFDGETRKLKAVKISDAQD